MLRHVILYSGRGRRALETFEHPIWAPRVTNGARSSVAPSCHLVGETFPGVVILHEFSVKIPPPCPAQYCGSTALSLPSARPAQLVPFPSQLERNFRAVLVVTFSDRICSAGAVPRTCVRFAMQDKRGWPLPKIDNLRDGRASLVLLPRTPASPRSQGRRHHRPGESEGSGCAFPRAPVPVETGETRARTIASDTSHILPHDPQATHISGHDSVCREHSVSMG